MPGSTPVYNLPYLELDDPPDIASATQDLAEDTEAALQTVAQQGKQRVRGGSVNWSTSASTTSGTLTATFSPAFSAPPAFTTQVVSGSGGAIRATVLVLSISASQAQFRVDLNAAATASGSVSWIAVGP